MALVVEYSPRQFFFQPRLHPSPSSQRHRNPSVPQRMLTRPPEQSGPHSPATTSTFTTAAATQTKKRKCTPHARGNMHAVPNDEPHHPRHHVWLHVRHRHADMNHKLHASRKRQHARSPTRQTAPPAPPPRRQEAQTARPTLAATCMPSQTPNRTTPVTARPTRSTKCTPHASGNMHAVPNAEPHHPRHRHADKNHQLHASRERRHARRPTCRTAPPPPPPRRQEPPAARPTQAATCTPSHTTSRTTPATASSSSTAAASATTTPTRCTSCTPHARYNLSTIPHDMLHRPRHRVQLHDRRSDADKKRKLHAKTSGNLNTVPHYKPHRPRHHVELHVPRNHACKKNQLHVARKRQRGHRPSRQAAPPSPPRPAPRPLPSRHHKASTARPTQAATWTPPH